MVNDEHHSICGNNLGLYHRSSPTDKKLAKEHKKPSQETLYEPVSIALFSGVGLFTLTRIPSVTIPRESPLTVGTDITCFNEFDVYLV